MEVTPQLLNEQEFREARRGYDMRDVDEFLERVAVGVARLQERLAALASEHETQRARITELESELQTARESGSAASETDETLRRTLVLAQRTADAAVAEAEEQAARTIAKAEEQAEFLLKDANESAERLRIEAETQARRAGEETRRQMLEELASLESARDALGNDARVLRRYLDDARARLRTAARDLQRLVDDPTALRELPAPETSGVELADVVDDAWADAPSGGEGDTDRAAADDTAADDVPDHSGETDIAEVDLDLGLTDELDPDDGDDDDHDYFEDLRRAMHDSDEPSGPDIGEQT